MQDTLDSALESLLHAVDDTYRPDRFSSTPFDILHQRVNNFAANQSRISELVKAALDEKAISLRRLNNERAPLHQLPTPILCDILAESAKLDSAADCMARYHRLAQVCKHWLNIIVGSTRFWHHIDNRHPERIDMILSHHRAGPISAWCVNNQADSFMEKARTKASYWTFVAFHCHFSDALKSALEEPTPNLRSLHIDIKRPSGDSDETKRIALSDGKPLWEVDLNHLALEWDSSRLVNLISLQLVKLDAYLPTIRQLHTILVASPKLEFLCLVEWVDFQRTASEDDNLRDISQPIALPRLTMLEFRSIPSSYKTYLFDHIKCCHLETLFTDEVSSRQPISHCVPSTCHIGCNVLRSAEEIYITFANGGKVCHLQSIPLIQPNTNIWSDDRKEPPGFDYTFNLGDTEVTWWRNFGSFLFEHLRNTTRVTLLLDSMEFSMRNSDGDLIPTPLLPPEILDESFHFINTLAFKGYYDIGSTLQFLSTSSRTEAGISCWPCPNLKVCDFRGLRDTKSRAGVMLRFVEARVQATLTIEAEAPHALETVKVPSGMAEMFNWVEGLRSVTFED